MSAERFAPRVRSGQWLVLTLLAIASVRSSLAAETKAESEAASESRLLSAVERLASDEFEGRGVGTKGIDLAADYIAEQFRALGLKTELFGGAPFQKFTIITGSRLGPAEGNTLSIVGPPEKSGDAATPTALKMAADFMPLALGGTAKFDLPLVFVGYGITAPELKYDDYAGVDVKGKAVIILQHEPQQDNPHSAFDGEGASPFGRVTRKISNAFEHGAKAVVFLTDELDVRKRVAEVQKRLQQAVDEVTQANEELKKLSPSAGELFEEQRKKVEHLGELITQRSRVMSDELDPLVTFTRFGEGGEGRSIPIFHVRRKAIDPIVKAALGTDLATLEKKIDEPNENGLPQPRSAELPGCRITGETSLQRNESDMKNVVAILEGEGPLADETIVIGAHYDHLGYGGSGSRDRNLNQIHHGADDNASGTAAMLEVARRLAARETKLPRRVMFMAFSGEERGLLGSRHYAREPLLPLDKTVAMLNMDMVGRLIDKKLVIYGTDTATEWNELIGRLNEKHRFQLTKHPEGAGPSDHASFYEKQVPVLHFFTGTHADYHLPGDTADKIDVIGMRRVTDLVTDIALSLAESPRRPTYQEIRGRARVGRTGDRPYFGSIPDYSQEKPGFMLMGVSKGGPAEQAGIKGGDMILQVGESRVENIEDFDSALRKLKAGDRVQVLVKRGGEEMKFEVTLGPPQ